MCARDTEPNGGLALAIAPTNGPGCASTIEGTIADVNDVDVFRTGNCDHSFTNTNAFVAHADFSPKSENLRVCLLFACSIGRPNVFNCYATDDNDSGYSQQDSMESEDVKQTQRSKTHVSKGISDDWDGGFNGCCRTGTGRVSAEVECGGIRLQAVKTFIWVDANEVDQSCQDYSVSYSVQ